MKKLLLAAVLALASAVSFAQPYYPGQTISGATLTVTGLTAGRFPLVDTGGAFTTSTKFLWTSTAGAGMSIVAGTSADNTQRALSISQTWTDGTSSNIGVVGNFDMGATGTATGKLLSLQAGAAGTTEVFSVSQAGYMISNGVETTSGFRGPGTGITIDASGKISITNTVDGVLNIAGWTATTTGSIQLGGTDANISRVSSGVLGIGTGAAGSMAGTVALAGVQVYNGTSAKVAVSGTAPTIASGGCTSPAVTSNNGTAAFLLTVGTSCTGVKTIVLTMPAASNLWRCNAENNTSDAAQQTNYITARATSTTAVTLTSYDRATGLQEDLTASDTILVSCIGA